MGQCVRSKAAVRIAETGTGETWRTLRFELDKLHLGHFLGPAREVSQRTETTSRQAAILKALAIAEPPRFCRGGRERLIPITLPPRAGP